MSAEPTGQAAGGLPGDRLTLRRVHDPDPLLLRELEGYDMAAFGPTGLRTYDIAVMAEAGAVFMAYLAEEVVGGCQLIRTLDEPDFFYVVGFYVRESWRRRGIGRESLRLVAAESRARGARGLLLTVAPDNRAALALYKGEGFVEERFIPHFYGENEDRLVLRWRFPEAGLPGSV